MPSPGCFDLGEVTGPSGGCGLQFAQVLHGAGATIVFDGGHSGGGL